MQIVLHFTLIRKHQTWVSCDWEKSLEEPSAAAWAQCENLTCPLWGCHQWSMSVWAEHSQMGFPYLCSHVHLKGISCCFCFLFRPSGYNYVALCLSQAWPAHHWTAAWEQQDHHVTLRGAATVNFGWSFNWKWKSVLVSGRRRTNSCLFGRTRQTSLTLLSHRVWAVTSGRAAGRCLKLEVRQRVSTLCR